MCQTPKMQSIRLGTLIVDHRAGSPYQVRQVGGREAHPVVAAALLESADVLALCEQDDLDNPAELDFDD